VKKPLAYFQRGNKWNTVFSFGQTYPLKRGAGEKGKFFFFYIRERERERERESEFTLQMSNGKRDVSFIAIANLVGACSFLIAN
jgi:hypothetical protein